MLVVYFHLHASKTSFEVMKKQLESSRNSGMDCAMMVTGSALEQVTNGDLTEEKPARGIWLGICFIFPCWFKRESITTGLK